VEGPRPDLLEAYGTDEVYLRNLEKRAADTIFGPELRQMSRGDYARMLVHAAKQQRVDHMRVQAAALNEKFRHLETMQMAETQELFGGPGTQRSRYVRAMMTRPYALHPLMMLQGGAMPLPPGAGDYGSMPADSMPGEMPEMAVTASVAAEVGKNMAKHAAAKEAYQQAFSPPQPVSPPPGYGAPQSMMTEAEQAGAGVKQMGRGALNIVGGVGRGVGKTLSSAGSAMGAIGRRLSDYLASDVQPTPKWGTGMAPAKFTNEYGAPVYG